MGHYYSEMFPDPPPTLAVEPAVLEIQRERDRQDAKWGPAEDQPDGLEPFWVYEGQRMERDAREGMAASRRLGKKSSYADILMEEVGEALQTTTLETLRAELIQVAAVCAKWVTILERRAG